MEANTKTCAGSRRRVVVLGSTGSIGTSTLDVIAHLPQRLQAWGLSAHSSWEKLLQQARQVAPRWLAVTDLDAADRLRQHDLPAGTQLVSGVDGIAAMVTDA